MKEIKLTRGKVALVDDEDFDKINAFRWHFSGQGYAERNVADKSKKSRQRKYRMHWAVIGEPDKGEKVDHINGNSLDNRRGNLRFCTHKENMRNSRKQSNNTSGYKGVYWRKDKKIWVANISVNNEIRYAGSSKKLVRAVIAYNKAAVKFFGKFARINPLPPDEVA